MGIDRYFLPNPEYGRGVYRRRIELAKAGTQVHVSLLDDFHDMRCVVEHDGKRVTNLDGEILRAPFTTCCSAGLALRELVHLPLTTGRAELYGAGRPQRNCTHLFDMVALALVHSLLPISERAFDFIVPDEGNGGALLQAFVDGQMVHSWDVVQETIRAPHRLSGRRLFGGFQSWAMATFDGVQLDAALGLQMAVFVARGRRYLVDQESGHWVKDQPERIGACFSFTEPQFSIAKSIPGYSRDFTVGLPEQADPNPPGGPPRPPRQSLHASRHQPHKRADRASSAKPKYEGTDHGST